MRKRVICSILMLFTLAFTGCGIETAQPEEGSAQTQEYVQPDINNAPQVESNLVGLWYCTRDNSCNNMEIVLEITQDGNTLYFKRNMQGQTEISSSYLEGTAFARVPNSAYAEFTQGDYSLQDGVLKEYFKSNDRWNLYTKDDALNEILDGAYITQAH